jgi:cholesterol transport system auxiliary component
MKLLSPLPSPRALPGGAVGALALIVIAAALASCALSPRSPLPKRMFLLEPVMPAAVAAPRPAALRVGVVNVGAPFRGKAFVYRQDELKYEADYYSEFFIAPVAMLSEATAKAMAASNTFRRVVPPGATADEGDYVLDGFASELYGDTRDAARPAAVLAMTFYVSSARAAVPGVLWSREYRQRVPLAGSDPEALARAWNVALSTILADLARDLAAAELPK